MMPIFDPKELLENLDPSTFRAPRSQCATREFLGSYGRPQIEKVEVMFPLKQGEYNPELYLGGLEVPDDKAVWMLVKCVKIERRTARQAAEASGMRIPGENRRERKVDICRLLVYNGEYYYNVGISLGKRDYTTNEPAQAEFYMTDWGLYLTATDKELLDEALERYQV